MSDWHELEIGRHRIRYQARDDMANPLAAYELEKWKAGQWTRVRSYESRTWFAFGIEAARKLQEGEQGSLFE